MGERDGLGGSQSRNLAGPTSERTRCASKLCQQSVWSIKLRALHGVLKPL